ncbi:BTB/POZ domain-containing protein At5g17580 [Rhododendron vialii]|uniref:BTB/POZ domain-containing protein At5g17580 n=1 Tax=Rhododendron vialii TaxID=182163 RepID=UPI00265F4F80|nr:BTB/POZ domain-containing protein At5g17580 [Rhododendron vialii]XP_058195326.1 BTB/POZ domain-containing protein At5g17580 [Rhododendron vialii]XP_058195327.1 BTB/POZ domain-containing protein At5g17580 [Rhododendron vialii]
MDTTTRHLAKSSSWLSKSRSSSHIQLHIRCVPFILDRELMAAKSGKIFKLLKENLSGDISHLLMDIPTDPETFELVVRFCHGRELKLSPENCIPLTCLSNYLGMTENHSTNNLLKRALTYLQQRILPNWNDLVNSLKASEKVLQEAVKLGLVDACFESIIEMALVNPHLLGELIRNPSNDDVDDSDSEEMKNVYRPNARRRLFVLDRKSEDLNTLSLQLYEPIIRGMIHRKVPPEYVAASICQYAKRWVFSSSTRGDDVLIYRRNSRSEVIEAVERLLPHEQGLLPCTFLFEMLNSAIILEASSKCKEGLEIRIGKQLDQATVKDLLIPSQGYAKEVEYDVECIKRILKSFYGNYVRSDISGLITVAELVEDFLVEVASDVDLNTETFTLLAEMSISASVGTQTSSDGIYRAIDVYLDTHRFLTESEREDVCSILDCHKLSPKAREHASQNNRLPLRVVVQVLFVGQLSLREILTKEAEGCDDRLRKVAAREEEEEAVRVGGCEEEVRTEMERMGSKVMELERECDTIRREIQSNCCGGAKKKEKGMWRDMKRKFGCTTSVINCDCHVKRHKKVHPRH